MAELDVDLMLAQIASAELELQAKGLAEPMARMAVARAAGYADKAAEIVPAEVRKEVWEGFFRSRLPDAEKFIEGYLAGVQQ